MKNIFLGLTLVGLLMVGCKNESTEASKSVENKVATSKSVKEARTATMKIDGMTCAIGCAKTIENKLAGLEGVQKASVDFDKKMATIEYDAAIQTPEKLTETIEGVADGKTYKVSEVKNL